MIKLRFSKPEFTVNEQSKIISCTYICDVYEAATGIIYDRSTVTGNAICHPNDTFNEKTGKHLADSRARLKAYEWARFIFVASKTEINELVANIKRIKNMLKFYSTMTSYRNNESIHINKLIKET